MVGSLTSQLGALDLISPEVLRCKIFLIFSKTASEIKYFISVYFDKI